MKNDNDIIFDDDHDHDDDPQQEGKCKCYIGWKGNECDILDLLPVDSNNHKGLQLDNNVSTWGGSIIYSQEDNKYHMYASRMINNCGLSTWTTNSEIIHAISTGGRDDDDPYLGPYKFVSVVVPIFAHDTNVIISPKTGEIVLYFTGRFDHENIKPQNCTSPTTPAATTTSKSTSAIDADLNNNDKDRRLLPPPKDSYMMYSKSPYGPWSKPVMVINSTKWNLDYWNKTHRYAICDTNLNGIIIDDDDDDGMSFIGIWRRCETPNLYTIPHLITASNWKDPTTYKPKLYPIFALGGSGAEDPSNIWITKSRDKSTGENITTYHVILHDEQATRCMLPTGCSGNGRHAFSINNGKSWKYAMHDAYTRNVTFINQNSTTTNNNSRSTMISNTRARPHIVIDPYNRHRLLALSTGLKPTKDSDYVWTLVQPIRHDDSNNDIDSEDVNDIAL